MAISCCTWRKLVLILAVQPLFLSCSGSDSAEALNSSAEKDERISGSSLFLQHCAVCHGENGKLGASGAKDLTLSILDSNQVIQMIKKGKNAMPPMKELLVTEENVALVTAHVLKLRK